MHRSSATKPAACALFFVWFDRMGGCENKMDDGGSKPSPYDDFIFPIFVGLDAHIEPRGIAPEVF